MSTKELTKGCEFTLTDARGKRIVCCVASEAEREEWVCKIKAAVAEMARPEIVDKTSYHKGPMLKRGQMNTAFQSRYFELKEGVIRYYENERECARQGHSKGTIDCKNLEVHVSLDADKSLSKLPPSSEWFFSGEMMKQVVTARGIKWHPRLAVLLQDFLTFAKQVDGAGDEHEDQVPELDLSLDDLRAVFDGHDYNGDGYLERYETKEAMKQMKMFTTDSDFERIFKLLDSDDSGTLDWKEFKVLAQRQAVAKNFSFHLTFSKHYDREDADANDQVLELDIPLDDLRAVFDEHDYNGDACLEREEAKEAMKAIKIFTTDSDFEAIFKLLDSDGSGTLDWQEFKALAQRQAVANHIIDYIPLEDITQVDFEIRAKGLRGGGHAHHDDNLVRGDKGFFEMLKSRFEAITGFDVDGDGKAEDIVVPDYNPDTHEMHLIIPTVENGHNMGRVYIHVVPHSEAQDWVSNLIRACSLAKERKRQRELEDVYGHSAWSYRRAQAGALYNSFTFQMLTFIFIVIGFFFDIAESQVLPEPDSSEAEIFFGIDAFITLAFTLELMVNLFAHSSNYFKPFLTQISNWFNTAVVLAAIANVILTSTGIQIPNAKLLRIVRIGRVVRLFNGLTSFQKLIAGLSSAILPVMNAFCILTVVTIIFAIFGTNFYHERKPEFFANFKTSLFTMFQVVTGDSWASGDRTASSLNH